MRKYGIVLVVCAIMLVVVLSSGCASSSTNLKQPSCPNCTVVSTPPVTAAVTLEKKGFEAYINGDYDSALDYYNQSLGADPKYTRAWIDKGNVLIRMNRTAEGIRAYDSALALESDLPELWNTRGEALMATGNYSAARDSFDRAIQLAPDFDQAKKNRNLTLTKLK
jgi:tetratricopeptide (TPR) repeat protein